MTDVLSGNAAISAAVEALKSGEDPEVAARGETSNPVEPEVDEGLDEGLDLDGLEEEDGIEDPDSNLEDDELEDSDSDEEAEPEESDEENPEEDEAEASEEDIEELTITDHKGRRQIKVDFNDREKLKKYVQMAALARKMQAERDSGNEKFKQASAEHAELKETWGKFENAWGDGGREGIISLLDLVNSENGGYDSFIETEYKRMRAKEDATPSELARIELEEKLEKAEASEE